MDRLLLLASDAATALFFFLGSAEFQYGAVFCGAVAYAFLVWKEGTLKRGQKTKKLYELRDR